MNSMKLKAAALALCLGLLAGCGMDESLIMTPETGEKIEVTLDRGDNFSMEETAGTVLVYQRGAGKGPAGVHHYHAL